MAKPKRYWRIRGYGRGFETIFDKMIPAGSITDAQMIELLKCLVAIEGRLTSDEIIGAYVKRRTKCAHDLLRIQNDKYPFYACGGPTPSFTALLVGDDGERIPELVKLIEELHSPKRG